MECGRLGSGLRWSAYSFALSENTPAVLIEDSSSDEQCPVNDNYLISFPEDSDTDSACDIKERFLEEVHNANEAKLLNRCYENPLFIPVAEVLKGKISDGDTEELMKSEAKKFEDYKFCEAVNDFDIELEAGEAVPIVYLSSTRAARLQRALRVAGYKKVCSI